MFKAGLFAETAENNGINALLTSTLLKGTRSRSGEQIAAQLEGAGGGIGTMSGNNSYGVSVGMMQPDTALGLELLADVILHPSFPEREFGREREAQLIGIRQDATRPMSVASKLMRHHLFDLHPYQWPRSGTEDIVACLERREVADFHARHAIASNAVVAVFGDVKTNEIVEQAEEYFAAIPSGELLAKAIAPAPANWRAIHRREYWKKSRR